MRNFESLNFWQRSHAFTIKIYKLTQSFPKDELFGLVSQMKRSASSVPTNIAEGCGRESVAELKMFLTIAAGSSSEVHYQLILSKDLSFIDERLFKELVTEIIEIRKMIYSYHDKL